MLIISAIFFRITPELIMLWYHPQEDGRNDDYPKVDVL